MRKESRQKQKEGRQRRPEENSRRREKWNIATDGGNAANKTVRSALDFRELNTYVACYIGNNNIDICSENMQNWRLIKGGNTIIDLKSAYLQLHVRS